MSAQGANLQRGHTWDVRPRTVAAIVAATFVAGVIIGRLLMPVAVGAGQTVVAVPGAAAQAPDRAVERDALLAFRAAERASSAAIVPATAEREALIDFRAGERSLAAAVPATAERDALLAFRAAERAASAAILPATTGPVLPWMPHPRP